MVRRTFLGTLFVGLLALLGAQGQPAQLPPADERPIPRPQADGPTSFVTAVQFSPDGKTLYVGGWDKVVHVWNLDNKGRFVLDRTSTYRIPIGPGLDGSINTMALSSDGLWLAVAGNGMVRELAGFRYGGIEVPSMGISTEMRKDRGMIYVFNTRTREVRLLRGHEGLVQALAFAPPLPGKAAPAEQPPTLVSIAQEWDEAKKTSAGAVRVWDVAKGESLARLGSLPNEINARPGLTVWRAGKDQGLRVAMAWADGNLRVWEVERGAPGLTVTKDGIYNRTISYHSGLGKLYTGSFEQANGWLKGWIVQEAAPQIDAGKQVAFPPVEAAGTNTYFAPLAMTLFSGKAGGKLDHAAVMLRVFYNPAKVEEDRLQLVALDGAKPRAVLAQPLPVARGGGTQPVLAASGRHLAVAGNRSHDVIVYGIDDLLKNQPQPQRLHSIAETIRYASFLSKGNDRGLLLNAVPKKARGDAIRAPAAGDLIFDFANRKLTSDLAGWKVDAPPLGNWNVIHEVAKDKAGKSYDQFAVSAGNKAVGKIALPPGVEFTDYALLPPGPMLNVAVLAVATHRLGQPELSLFDVSTGQPVRRFDGHTERIRSLAFAADGKLLVSSAEDQTVCVWSLADLDKVYGQHGLLPGLAVKDGPNGTVMVGRIDEQSVAQGKLNEEDVIAGIVVGAKLQPLTTAREFYNAIWGMKPGATATLRVGKTDVPLKVGQGIDRRNPLVCLFVTRGATAADRDWLGWNPHGPYDSSRAEAERYLGWHINTGKPESPTRFAEAGQYQKEYQRPNLLKHLVARGRLDQALEDWDRETKAKKQARKLPEPSMNLRIAEAGPDPQRLDGYVQVRETPQTLKLAIDNFSPEDVANVTWQVEGLGAKPVKFGAPMGQEWTADLSKLPWNRGAYKIRVDVLTQEEPPRKYVQELPLRYQPLAPIITAKQPVRQVVDKPEFTVQATIQPGTPGQAVGVLLSHRHKDKALPAETQGLAINKTLKLQPGENLIEIIAANKDALRGYEELETSRRVIEVTFAPPVPDPKPIIALDSILPLGGDQTLAIEPGKPVIVNVPRVRLGGKIQATKNLVKADWAKVGAAKEEKLAKFVADKQREFTLAEDLNLQPGEQKFRVTAKTATSEIAEATVAVFYRPPVPKLVLLEPAQAVVLYEGKDPAEVQVRYRMLMPPDTQKFAVVVMLNDSEQQKIVPQIDAKTQSLTARVPVQHGDNRIQIKVSNQWNVVETSEDIVVARYLRPPRIVKLDGPKESDKPLADLTATVHSALPLLSEAVEAEVTSSLTRRPRRIATASAKLDAGQTWNVQLKDVPLEEGANQVRLFVSNTDARSLEGADWTVTYKKKAPPPPPPDVEISLDPRDSKDGTNVYISNATIRLTVASKSPLRRLEMRQEPGFISQAIDVSKLAANPQGVYELKLSLQLTGTAMPSSAGAVIDPTKLKANPQGFLEAATDLRLAGGLNRFKVEAVNGGNQAEASLVVNYFLPPVVLDIDAIEPRGWQGDAVLPKKQQNAPPAFPAIAQGRVWLRGHVTWDKDQDDQLKQMRSVQVFVNGLRQAPVDLEPPAGNMRQRAFRAAIAFNQATDNKVLVELPGLKQDANNRQEFSVACQKPENTRVHLLIVGVGEQNEKELIDRVLLALHAEQIDLQRKRFKTPTFSEGRLYPPLTGYVRPGQVLTELRRIKDEIDLLAKGGATSDVMMVFYQGGVAQQGNDHYFLTSVSQHIPELRRSGINRDSLVNCLGDTLGAQLVLMEVNRQGTSPGNGNWAANPKVAMLGYEWPTQATAPMPVRFTKVLGDALPGARTPTLHDIAQHVRQLTSELTSKAGQSGLVYIQDIPARMGNLEIGQRKP
jgi:WD40 repeat protein